MLNALLSLYPEAPIYTLFYDAAKMPESITSRDVISHPLLQYGKKLRKALLPLLPRAIESFDLSAYDLILSTSSCVAKGAIKGRNGKHLCYIHSPMRYIWDQQEEYLAGVSHIPLAQWGIKRLTPGLREWDIESAGRVDQFVANSTFVAERVANFYHQNRPPVVHPPIDVEACSPYVKTPKKGGYFIAAGALVSYKRFDLAIQAAEHLGKKLIVAGSGPMEGQLRREAKHHTEFVINPNDHEFRSLLRGADALLFPGVEDFGMVAVEAMALGTPVIAYQKGGARDFIEPNVSGMFFANPTVDSLAQAMRELSDMSFSSDELVEFAKKFNQEAFLKKMTTHITHLLERGSR